MNRALARASGFIAFTLTLLVLSGFLQSAYGQPVRIMPLGDSTTSGYRQYVSYRYDLWFQLVDAGFEVDFVGGNTTTDGSPNLDWYPGYLTNFDRNHQGYSGYRTDELANIARWVAAAQEPHIVLLWAGINDIWAQGAGGVMNARFGLRDTISGIRTATPGTTILLALTPPYDQRNGEFVEPLNEAIAQVAAELDSPGSPIILVDLYTGYSVENMTWDNVHQNRTGEAWVADKWFQVLANILPDTETFQINAGHSGAWFNPQTSGQGLLLEVEPEEQYLFLSWFTYTEAASANPREQHWFTAQGSYSGNSATLPVFETLGGRFDHPQPVNTESVGLLTVQFDDCEQGTVSYAIDTWDARGAFPIQRLIPGSGNVCRQQSGQTPEAVDINLGMDGSWYNPDAPGQGFLVDVHANPPGDNLIFIAWFTYGDDTASGQRWLTAQGSFAGPSADIPVYETTGGSFDDPQATTTTSIGTLGIDFSDCSHASLSYRLPDEGVEGSMNLTRLLPGSHSLCDEFAASE